ncbi:class I adenylate-forming enzyme family protein [Profundibacterium mesophilum]|uniref:Acetyl-CoA synthetase n=1 Tax=Profundibacterium mesophilum KAUST100406-0324 TaxID=1037889 RepID=A0A921NSQ7_9RHOB|nr:class I adenylate-forming enzyme family protein [Profundibacterium mesophilum]KAF0674748.1 acetyl-CoA synthetase [Profundibacterium mesophilum KAUST100406-0324]
MPVAIHDSPPPAPAPAQFNMAAHVLAHAGRHPGKTALEIVGGAAPQSWSYGALEAAVRGTASGLRALHGGSLAPGSRILIRLGNTVDFPILYLAALACDMVPVPTSAQLTMPEITKLAQIVEPSVIVAAEGVALPQGPWPVITQAELGDMRALPPSDYALGDPDRLGYIVFSSGTSGTPRAVCHAHRAVWARRMMVDGWYGLGPDDRLLHAGAFNWTYTLGTGLMDPWAIGATALISEEGTPAARLPALLREHDVTIFAAAPGVYRQMLKHPEKFGKGALRHGLSAGEKLPPAIREAWRGVTRTEIHEAYGMSECSTFVSGSPADPAPAGTLGRPQPGRRVAVLNPDGAPAPRGAPGQLAISRGDTGLMLGYLGDPASTSEKFSGSWFLTGDMAQMDETGAVSYLGRDDDLMNAGGFRVSPLEIEEVLALCPGIVECAAAEVEVRPDVSVIAAFYVSAAPITEETLAAHCADRLAAYKRPRLYVRLEALPRGANNKLLRRTLRSVHSLKGQTP